MHMLNGSKAWLEVIKLGPVAKLDKEVNNFYRNIVVQVFQKEGWFDFLSKPHSIDEIATEYHYTDRKLLETILETLVQDRTLEKNYGYYNVVHPLTIHDIKPKLLNQGNIDLSLSFVNFLPERLRGKFYTSTSGFNLYNFDDALTNNLYKQVRKSVLAFTGAINKEGNFLDLGTGSGNGISNIFSLYLKKGAFDRENVAVRLYGIDVDQSLMNIAEEEFFNRVHEETNLSMEELQKYEKFKPEFKNGNAINIPYPKDYFDIVYISQVLHWTDPQKAIQEMYRVTKEGGMVIGGQILRPFANEFLHLMMLVIDGAHGFFTKDQMKAWAIEAGFKKMYFATPITTFMFKK